MIHQIFIYHLFLIINEIIKKMHCAGFEPARFSADELKSSSLTTRTTMLTKEYLYIHLLYLYSNL